MMTNTGGMERSVEEYTALLKSSGFAFTRLIETDSAMSIVKA